MKNRPSAKVEAIRKRIDHPIVDADAHQLETVPVLLDYLSDVGGSDMPDRFLAFLKHQRRTFDMTPAERLDTRTSMPVWWPIPTENTLDRATTQLPRLMYERLDEFGLDFSIVYPGIGLQIVTLPGMPDDELRRACARAFNTCNAELFSQYADRLTPAAVIPMNTPEEAIAELEYAVTTLGLKVAVIAGDVLRPVPSVAREHAELAQLVTYEDCFGLDSPHDYDPVWAKCSELGVAVSRGLAQALVEERGKRGIAARHADGRTSPPRHALLLKGQFLTVDEGSRILRMTIGFGAGATQLRVRVHAYQATEWGLKRIAEAEVKAQGNKMPGMAAPVGVGAATGNVVRSVAISGGMNVMQEVTGGLQKDAGRIAGEIAERVKGFYERQGWL